MAEITYEGEQYTLRAGSPMATESGDFVLQTFMAEKNKIITYMITDNLPGSEEFRGQGGDYISANFSRLSDKSGNKFQGKIVYSPVIVDEDDI